MDPEGATDLDDALAAARGPRGSGFQVSVAITDPSYWLDRLGVWEKLTDRTTTLYLPDEKRQMLPSNLSEGLCSLQARRPRAAVVLLLSLDAHGRVTKRTFRTGKVAVARNYVYEDAALLRSEAYKIMWEATRLAQDRVPLLDGVEDSHDVVAYWMLKFNLEIAQALATAETGVFRCAPRPQTEPHEVGSTALPAETRALLRHWGGGGGAYVNWADKREHGGIGGGDMLYAQGSSPIRRMCDLVNVIALKRALALGTTTADAEAFVGRWLARLDELNRAAKAAKRLQSECELLSRCSESTGAGAQSVYVGVPLERELRPAYSMSCFRYTVHLVDLRHVVRVDTDVDLSLMTTHRFSLHLFLDEASMHRKVRVAPV